ncbi:MAG: AraC family transcriptional regulator [Pseudomonadota bacterium]
MANDGSEAADPVNRYDSGSLPAPVEADERFTLLRRDDEIGELQFRIGRISRDVSYTHSRGHFRRDYHAEIRYDEDTTLLVFGLSGFSDFRPIEDAKGYRIKAGDVWYLRLSPGTLQRTTAAQHACEMVVIKFTGRRLVDALGSSHPQFYAGRNTAHRLARQAREEFDLDALLNNPLDRGNQRLLAESQALALLARWIAPVHQALGSLAVARDCGHSDALRATLEEVVGILVGDPAQPPSLEELAARANMSHTRLNRCFKQAYGATVYAWLRDYRLAQSRQLLLDGDQSVTAIAYRLGFSSPSHFASAFKRHYGRTPGEFAQRPDRGR